ncbi:MAG: hypothetical protein JSS45_11920 [Proteobacteria bacterium]|nr:hypothetical protein [Pseudomonadota bacterium]
MLFSLFGLACIFLASPLNDFYPAVRLSLGALFLVAGLSLLVRWGTSILFKALVWANFLIWILAILGDPEAPHERIWSVGNPYLWLVAIGLITIAMLFLISKIPTREASSMQRTG